MNIVIDNSGYDLCNVGDAAMLQIAVERLHKLFPEARLKVFTRISDRLRVLCPQAEPLDLRGREKYFQPWNILGGAHKLLPKGSHSYLLEMEQWLECHFPELATHWIKYRLSKRGWTDLQLIDEYKEAITTATLVVASGGGYLNDSFPLHAEKLLRTLKFAQYLGLPTALLGQGIGPLKNGRLKRLAKQVLRRVDLIGLREAALSRRILEDFGVSQESIFVTGDDAVELAYRRSLNSSRKDIGVNLRLSYYSSVSAPEVTAVRRALFQFSEKVGASFRAIPISFCSKESDLDSVQRLLGEKFSPTGNQYLDTPEASIQAAGMCRIVVTGSYHAAVFALSQGIPVIGLSKSEYYASKFIGLKRQFGTGCEHIVMSDPHFESDLLLNLEKMWNLVEDLHSQLLSSARFQIETGVDFYEKLQSLCLSNGT